MPRYPTLFDDCKTLSISFLNQHSYLVPNQYKSGTVTWSRNGNKIGSISIAVSTYSSPYIELDYKCNDTPVNYRIDLVSIPSNIGEGRIWYFLCPQTGKRCRKLHMADTYFFHREAFRGCMYEKQTYSHSKRQMDKLFDIILGNEGVYEKLYSKHFKSYYNGKPTKKYLRLMQQIGRSEQYSPEELERLYLA